MSIKYLAMSNTLTKYLCENNQNQLPRLVGMMKKYLLHPVTSKKIYSEDTRRLVITTLHDRKLFTLWDADRQELPANERWILFRFAGDYGLFNEATGAIPGILERVNEVVSGRVRGVRVDGVRPLKSGTIRIDWGNRYLVCREYVPNPDLPPVCVEFIGPHANATEMSDELLLDEDGLPEVYNHLQSMVLDKIESSEDIELVPASLLDNAVGGRANEYELRPFKRDEIDRARNLNFDMWMAENSPLVPAQREILQSNLHPGDTVRILGLAGSGKTLTLLLLAVKTIQQNLKTVPNYRAIFFTHNLPSKTKQIEKIKGLGVEYLLEKHLFVRDLSEFLAKDIVKIPDARILNRDSDIARESQRDLMAEAVVTVQKELAFDSGVSAEMQNLLRDVDLRRFACDAILNELSIAIYANGVTSKDQYVRSAGSLSELHRELDEADRGVIFDVIQEYWNKLSESGWASLDPDQLVHDAANILQTNAYKLRRAAEGYDLVLVDEAQLFGGHEQTVLIELGRTERNPTYACALDHAQDYRQRARSGLGACGFKNIITFRLPNIIRCAPRIQDVALFVRNRTKLNFESDFKETFQHEGEEGEVGIVVQAAQESLSQTIIAALATMRENGTNRCAAVVFDNAIWNEVEAGLSENFKHLHVIRERNEMLEEDPLLTVLSTPENIGGAELDGIVIVGIERTVFPPTFIGNGHLAMFYKEKSYRNLYTAITRAKQRVTFVARRRQPIAEIIKDAENENLVRR